MKKGMILILTSLLLLSGCTAAEEGDLVDIAPVLGTPAAPSGSGGGQLAPGEAAPAPSPVPGGLGIANPLRASDAEGILSELGISMAPPPGAEALSYSIIDDRLAQLSFSLEGVEYTYRIAKTAGEEDISGVYTQFEAREELEYQGQEYSIAYTRGSSGLALWYDQLTSQTHSLYMENSAELAPLQSLAEALMALAGLSGNA